MAVMQSAWIIPALAGNTCAVTVSTRSTGDHPRACGEHLSTLSAINGVAGSSPRLRGTPERLRDRRDGAGIIPALAGNTSVHTDALVHSWDHPRACGEHSAAAARLGVDGGIIPALAGNTVSADDFICPTWDHPRACGEHGVDKISNAINKGSSPRLRGTLG